MAFSVLIVDDSRAMRTFIRRVLDMTGLEIGECVEAGDGQQALEMLSHHWVDIVLTDINMPVMTGEQLLQHMSIDPIFHGLPVLVISTDRSEARLERMMALGAKGYITKPFHPEGLREAMEALLAGGTHDHS